MDIKPYKNESLSDFVKRNEVKKTEKELKQIWKQNLIAEKNENTIIRK
jgi:hypothetical protein